MNIQDKIQQILNHAVEQGHECGCQAALFINGELAVNAYAGYTDWSKTKRVDENTIFPIYSTGKAPSSTVLHRLVEKGLLSYDTCIGDVWPEFACNGKEDMQIWHVLSYRCGLFDVPEATDEERADFGLMIKKMAKSTPAYAPGTKQQYHPLTYGWLTGGIACAVLKRYDYFQIFKELVGIPAGMDRFFYGIAESENNKATLVNSQNGNTYSQLYVDQMNDPLFQRCCNPSTCAMSNALSIARHYTALDTESLLRPETLTNATQPWRSADDFLPLVKGRWELFGLGYVLSGPPSDLGQIFGHGGVGGSEGLLDRKQHFAIGITRNVFADPNVAGQVYDAIGLKNRNWPDSQ